MAAAAAHGFTKEQVAEYKEQFDAFDEDGSGTIEVRWAAFAGRLRLAWGMGDGWPPPSLEIFAWRRQVNPMQRTRCTPFRLPCRPAS
jgi:hypothetical protein